MVLSAFLIFKLESMSDTDNNIYNALKDFKIIVYCYLIIKIHFKIIANLFIMLQCEIYQ